MPATVEELKQSSPALGGDFELLLDRFPLVDLYKLLETGTDLVLHAAEASDDQLNVIGSAFARGVRLTSPSAAHAANEFVTGQPERIDAAGEAPDATGLATAWVLDPADGPRVLVQCNLTDRAPTAAEPEWPQQGFATPVVDSRLAVSIGVKGTGSRPPEPPRIGQENPGSDEVGVRRAGLATVGPGGVLAERGPGLNAAVVTAIGEPPWPPVRDSDLEAGLWLCALFARPGQGTHPTTNPAVERPSESHALAGAVTRRTRRKTAPSGREARSRTSFLHHSRHHGEFRREGYM
ncbi:hypothetical protein ACFVXG_15565 [Kitasatospora sp. NPDC058162]|uniref:hypothetical protein n=1 Tax=Kitasatospora sp. NPDC058162 TaxID=3346362 RepID=UPI0036DF4837